MSLPWNNSYNSQDSQATQAIDPNNPQVYTEPDSRPIVTSVTQSVPLSPLNSLTAPVFDTNWALDNLADSQADTAPIASSSAHTVVISQSQTQLISEEEEPPARRTRAKSQASIIPATQWGSVIQYSLSQDSSVQVLSQDEDDVFIVENVVGKYMFQGQEYYEIKWEGWSQVFNTLENGSTLSATQKANILKPKRTINGDKMKKMDQLLKIHCEVMDELERKVYSELWQNLEDYYTCAVGAAVLHGYKWAVWSASEYEKALKAVETLATLYPRAKRLYLHDACITLDEELDIETKYNNEPTLGEEKEHKDLEHFVYPAENEDKKKDGAYVYKFPANEDFEEDKGKLQKLFQRKPRPVSSFSNLLEDTVIIDLEVHAITTNSPLSQLCAVNLLGSKVFNCYIQHQDKPYLQREWASLKESGYVDTDPCDSKSTSVSFPDAILALCLQFTTPGSLFLYKGTTDYSTLLLNFRWHLQFKSPKIEEAIEQFMLRQYRFMPVDRVFKSDLLPVSLATGSSSNKLQKIYNEMFFKSLMFSNNAAGLVYSQQVRIWLSKTLLLIDASFKEKVKGEAVDIWYWADGKLEPVFHYAHTDALHTRNCLLAIATYQLAKQELKEEALSLWKQVMTGIVSNTVYFRKFHLGCTKKMAQWIAGAEYSSDPSSYRNTRFLPVQLFNEMNNKDALSEEDEDRNWRETEYIQPMWLSPESGKGKLLDFLEESEETLLVESKHPEFTIEVYPQVKIQTEKPTASLINATLAQLILVKDVPLEGAGCRLPKQFVFQRSDLENFLAGKSEKDKAFFTTWPCIVIQNANSAERFPKTFILHCKSCPFISHEGRWGSTRMSSQQSLNVIDFRLHPVLSYRLRFCKRCKKWQAVQPGDLNRYGSQVAAQEQSEIRQALNEPRSQSQPQIIVQPAPVIIQGNQRNPVQRAPQQPDARKPLVGQPFVRKKGLY